MCWFCVRERLFVTQLCLWVCPKGVMVHGDAGLQTCSEGRNVNDVFSIYMQQVRVAVRVSSIASGSVVVLTHASMSQVFSHHCYSVASVSALRFQLRYEYGSELGSRLDVVLSNVTCS